MKKREESRGDGFPETILDESNETVIKEEDDEPMDTTEQPKNPDALKDEIKDEDDIKEEKPDTAELDKSSSQPNKVLTFILPLETIVGLPVLRDFFWRQIKSCQMVTYKLTTFHFYAAFQQN